MARDPSKYSFYQRVKEFKEFRRLVMRGLSTFWFLIDERTEKES